MIHHKINPTRLERLLKWWLYPIMTLHVSGDVQAFLLVVTVAMVVLWGRVEP